MQRLGDHAPSGPPQGRQASDATDGKTCQNLSDLVHRCYHVIVRRLSADVSACMTEEEDVLRASA